MGIELMTKIKIQMLQKIPKRLKKVLIGVLLFIILYTIIGFVIFPFVLKLILTKKISENLHRKLVIKSIKFNPYNFKLIIRGFDLKERSNENSFVSFEELYINLQIMSLFKKGVIIKEIRFTEPFINIVLNEDNTYNFSDLITGEKPQQKSESKPFRFSINNIQILDGGIHFFDKPKQTKHKLDYIILSIPSISNLPYYAEIFVEPFLTVSINDVPFRFVGKTKPFADSLETVLDVNIMDLDIPYYLAYFPMKMNYKFVSGYTSVNTQVSYIQYKNKPPSLEIKGGVSFKDIKLQDMKNNPMIHIPLLEVDIALAELFTQNIHLNKILVQQPAIDITRDNKGVINLMSLIPKTDNPESKSETTAKPKTGSEAPPFNLDIDEIKVKQARVSFADSMPKEPFQTTLQPLDISINKFTLAKDKKSEFAFSFQTEKKESLKIAGNFSINPMKSEGKVELQQLLLNKYSPYYKDGVLFSVEDGKLNFSTKYECSQGKDNIDAKLSSLGVSLDSLRLKKRNEKEDFLNIPNFSIKDSSFDLGKKEIVFSDISSKDGSLILKRLKNGELNIQTLVAPLPQSQEKKTSKKKVETTPKKETKSKKEEKPFLIKLNKFSVNGYTIKAEDEVPTEPVKLIAKNIKFKIENFSTAKKKKASISLNSRLNDRGTVATNGTVGLDPLSADLNLDFKYIDKSLFYPYVADILNLIITDAFISVDGKFKLTSVNNEFKVTYTGNAYASGFKAIDRNTSEEFLKFGLFAIEGIDAGFNPTYVAINRISLSDFFTRFVINPDGSLNVQKLVIAQESQASSSQSAPVPASNQNAPAPPIKMKIDSINFEKGHINFIDKQINPNYSTDLVDINGKISGLLSEESSVADINLSAKLDRYAPLVISGKINPLAKDLFVDMKIDFKNMDLSPLSPFSGKFVGYNIEKGTLGFDLAYSINKKKLDAQHRVLVDQFTFGGKVESPDATKLPVRFAVALLKDRRGQIKLDLPVSGYIDDPEFKLGKIIIKVLINFIVKVTTSPFAALGGLVGDSEQLSYIEFESGSFVITEQNIKKVDALITALYDKPALKLDIEGYVDPKEDEEGLRQYLFNKKLKAQKLQDMIKKGQPAIPVDEVKIEPAEYEEYLWKAYKREEFQKETILGIVKKLPAPEMEKLILTHIVITENDLNQLASQRAKIIKDYILKSGKVETDRIFVVQPKSLAPEKKENVKNSRVDFKLK